MAAAQHHKHVLIGCPAAADYESTVVMRDACVAEDVALQDVVPFSHHTRTEEILSTIAESRFFGEVRRVDVAFTISASSEDFLEGAGKGVDGQGRPARLSGRPGLGLRAHGEARVRRAQSRKRASDPQRGAAKTCPST